MPIGSPKVYKLDLHTPGAPGDKSPLVINIIPMNHTLTRWCGGLGTIPHGHYTDPDYQADYYTGHVIALGVDGTKKTDISNRDNEWFSVHKSWDHAVDYMGHLSIKYRFSNCRFPSLQYLRFGHLTFLPHMWDVDSLRIGLDAGGPSTIWYPLTTDVAHDEAVSPIVSTRHCLGTRQLWGGDRSRSLCISVSGDIHAVPLLRFRKFADGKWFLRVLYSIYERDETSRICTSPDIDGRTITLSIKNVNHV